MITFFACASLFGEAQVNLVKNPSFELRDTCPWTVDQISTATYWSCIDTEYMPPYPYVGNPNCSPEYINGCATNSSLREPVNPLFYHYCRTGEGMAQAMMYFNESVSSEYKRDYLQGRLYSQLTTGQSYCVTFFVLLERSRYANNNIGAYLDDGSIDTNSNCGYPHPEVIPQARTISIVTDTTNWTKIQGSFVANGTERYITIGNFYDTAHTLAIDLHPGPFAGYSYYLVDDVSVIASNATAYAGPDVSIGAGDSTYIGLDSNGDGMPCYWYVMGGTSPIDSGGRILVKPSSTTSYVVVMDLCGVVTYDTVVVSVVPLGNVQMWKHGNVQIYPNPTTGSCTIQHAKGAKVMVYDLVGSVLKRLVCEKDEEEMDINDLQNGVYIVDIMKGNGERQVVRLLRASQ